MEIINSDEAGMKISNVISTLPTRQAGAKLIMLPYKNMGTCVKQKLVVSVFIFLLLLPTLSISASANSSWVWLTRDPRPMLPWAIVGTLVIEIFVICFFNNIQVKNILTPTISIVFGNLISFLLPYIFIGIIPYVFEENANFFSRINYTAEKLPFYIIGIVFLVLTLIIELPIEYFCTRHKVKSKKKLLATILAANVFTTAAVAIIERTIYKGHW